MPDFIFEANIPHHKKLLAADTDAEIEMLRKLLTEEEAKLARWHEQNRSNRARPPRPVVLSPWFDVDQRHQFTDR